MPDAGDSVTAALTVDPFDLTTLATLIVTGPDDVTTSVTVTTANAGATWTGLVAYNQPGEWILAWTVTGTGVGSGSNNTPLMRLKIAVVAPIPSPSVSTATVVKPGFFRSIRVP